MRRFRVDDHSMEPALRPGDQVICGKAGTRVHRGSIVVFPHPSRTEMWMVKRVIALADDEVTIDFGNVLVNDDGVVDRWSGDHNTFPEGRWVVGPGQVFVLSDNRSATVDDSRSFGPIKLSDALPARWPPRRGPRVRP
ncbi:MAG: signal peptidase I [Acidimicrobiia bacterium]